MMDLEEANNIISSNLANFGQNAGRKNVPEKEQYIPSSLGVVHKLSALSDSSTIVASTVHDFAAVATAHGINYVFDKKLGKIERLVWLVVCCFCIVEAIIWSKQAYDEWRDEPIITSVKTTGKQNLLVKHNFFNDYYMVQLSISNSCLVCHFRIPKHLR